MTFLHVWLVLGLISGCVSGNVIAHDSLQADTGNISSEDTHPSFTDTSSPVDSTDTANPEEGCALGMVRVEAFCMDRYEAGISGQSPYVVPNGGMAVVGKGMVPQGYISGVAAQNACEAAGKRLCSAQEWLRACEGPDGWVYPYGDVYDPTRCNVSRDEHPMLSYFGDGVDWSGTQMNDPGINQQTDTVDITGGNPGCVSSEGVYDLHGNLHEWVDNLSGVFKGGFYMDASINGLGCSYTTTAHDLSYHDYSTGFRCCMTPE